MIGSSCRGLHSSNQAESIRLRLTRGSRPGAHTWSPEAAREAPSGRVESDGAGEVAPSHGNVVSEEAHFAAESTLTVQITCRLESLNGILCSPNLACLATKYDA